MEVVFIVMRRFGTCHPAFSGGWICMAMDFVSVLTSPLISGAYFPIPPHRTSCHFLSGPLQVVEMRLVVSSVA